MGWKSVVPVVPFEVIECRSWPLRNPGQVAEQESWRGADDGGWILFQERGEDQEPEVGAA
jgi:hypothetical protein